MSDYLFVAYLRAVPSLSDNIEIEKAVTAYGSSEEQAKLRSQRAAIQLSQNASLVSIDTTPLAFNGRLGQLRVNLLVKVPAKLNVVIDGDTVKLDTTKLVSETFKVTAKSEITVNLPEQPNLKLVATTLDGQIQINGQKLINQTADEQANQSQEPQRTLRKTYGQGHGRIQLENDWGNIEIRE